MNPVEAYFTELRDIRASGGGVAETSYYGALASLLNEIGRTLKPRVRTVSQLKNLGAGAPDFGLFIQQQFAHTHDAEPLAGQPPARGVVEVKGTSEDVFDRSKWPDPEQVERYIERYGHVLVTNLRDFVLVGRDAASGAVTELESCRLARSDIQFWDRCDTPRKFAAEAGEGLTEFLKRVMLAAAPLADPKDVAWFLASYARTARLRLEQQQELPALSLLRSQLEEALGLEFAGEKGDHFFRSTLVQTLFYGVFAAWVLWSRQGDRGVEDRERFEWELASRTLDVPFISALFYQFADPHKLGELRIDEVLNWTEDVLSRVDRAAFFERFREEHAVQYFYEPFLEAFDPELRKELGVWYTPDEVVRYMVAKVDAVLREELGVADGLADESVWVLDPCCGTGAYLVQVLRRIDATLQAKGADALTRQDVKRAAMKRVVGFEILPAPFVIAHLQLGLLLAELGVPLSHVHGEHERAAVYLTNALTGWQSHEAPTAADAGGRRVHPAQLLFEFEEERDAAAKVKREAPILVVLGNPPYNGFAGVAADEEADLVEPYKRGLRAEWGINKNYLDDLYVRFFRLAERSITASPRGGVVCLISNFSWLSNPSAVVMRKSILSGFQLVSIDNLNGDSRETGKRTPEGLPDPSIFSGPTNRQGIQVGTAIAQLVCSPAPSREEASVLYRDFWGQDKRAQLASVASGESAGPGYVSMHPAVQNRFSLRPVSAAEGYSTWPAITELGAMQWSLGLNENRSEALVDGDQAALAARMRVYLDDSVAQDAFPAGLDGLRKSWARFDPEATRAKLIAAGGFDSARIVPFLAKPFDARWAYAEPRAKLWNEARAALMERATRGRRFLLARARSPRAHDGAPFALFSGLADQHALHTDAYLMPVDHSLSGIAGAPLVASGGEVRHDLSARAAGYLAGVSGKDSQEAPQTSDLWMHVLAIGYAPTYQAENDHAVRADWPRVPLPRDCKLLLESAALGERLADLLDVSPWSVSTKPDLPREFGVLSSVTALDPSRDLAITAQWGIAGKNGITMPSNGRITERTYAPEELAAIAECATKRGLATDEATLLLGESCVDVWLNDVAYWSCVPGRVWHYTIGGHQVIKKWLSYRQSALLGRGLTVDEARYVSEMIRRIAALVLLESALDANYEQVKTDTYDWQQAPAPTGGRR